MAAYNLSFQSLLIFSASLLLSFNHAYTIHENCAEIGCKEWVQQAADEAINIATYAAYRATNNRPTIDNTIFKSIMGDADLNQFAATMTLATTAIGTFTGMFSLDNVAADPTVVIYCDDTHLVKETTPQLAWVDQTLETSLPVNWGDLTACHGQAGLSAYTYNTELRGYGPASAIVLCTGTSGALALSKIFDNFQTIREGWRELDWNGKNFDYLKWYTPETIVHEIMHTRPVGMGAALPGGLGPERYSMADIIELPANGRSQNPESYATAATALWMANNRWVGNVDGQQIPGFGDLFPHNERPTGLDISMHDYPPT